MFEDIQQHRAAVAENIKKAMEIGFTGNELEKAHKVGDIHPNGKWVWTQLPSGKYDWRVIKKTGAGSGGSAPAAAQKTAQSGEDLISKVPGLKNLKEYLTIFNSKYTDFDKVSLSKTPKGNWDVRYDGHRLGIMNGDQISESVVKKMGFHLSKEEKEKMREDSFAREKEKREKLAKEKSGGEKKEFKIGSQITKENVEDFADRINRGELHVVYTYGKSQNYVVKKAAKPYNENGKTKVQLTFQYIGNDKNNADYPDGTQVDDWKIEELNDRISRGKITVARKNGSAKKTDEKHKETKAAKVPSGHRIHYEDDLVEVYDDKGKKVYSGLFDYCDYKDENYKWNETDKNYDLPHGYKLVGKTKH